MNVLFDIKGHFHALGEVVALLSRHRQLTVEMARRELTDRYLGQVLGAFWVLGHPIMMMGVYVFIFGFVFKMKMGGTPDMPLDYTAYLLAGLIPWLSFQETISKSGTVITNNANLVKQVVFPIEVLPVKGVISSLITMLILFVILVVYVVFSAWFLPLTYLLLPALVFFQALAMIGASYILAATGVYFKDVKDFVQVFNLIGVYLMPAIYLPEQVPVFFRPLLYLNPFSYMTWCYQDALYYGRIAHWWAWPVFIFMSVAVFYAGYRIFRKLKMMFGNVL